MEKRDYVGSFIYSFKSLKENPILYVPDLIFFIGTALLSLLFLHFNGLTSIFHGFSGFNSQIKNIASNGSLLWRMIFSLLILLALNLILGWGTVTGRFTMIKLLIDKKKFTLKSVAKYDTKYLLPVLGLKAVFFLIYVIPALVLLGLGLLFNQLFFILLLMFLFYLIVTRFVFLFSYSILFFDDVKNPFKVIDRAVHYFKENKLHAIVVGLLAAVITGIVTLVLESLPTIWGNFGIQLSITFSIIYLIIKTLIEISFGLWSAIFVFKNYN